MEDKEKPKSKAGTIIGIGFMAFVLFFLASMWIPGLTGYRSKQFCQNARSDANNIMAAIADYFSVAEHTDIARSDIEKLVAIDNPWTFIRKGDEIYISVTDAKKNCPVEYQHSLPEWDRWVYTKVMPYTDPADR